MTGVQCGAACGCDWKEIKSYAKQIIKTIRKKDKKAIIVVGTPTWSQLGPDGTHNEVADSPIKGYKNIMYSLHFYANEWSHNEHVGCEWQWSDQYDKYRKMEEKRPVRGRSISP